MELNEIETPKYLLCDVDIRNGKRIEKYSERINFNTLKNRFPKMEVLRIEEIAPSRCTYILLENGEYKEGIKERIKKDE